MLKTSLALMLLLMAGCAEFNSGGFGQTEPYTDPYTQADFDGLLSFGANMANMPVSSRTEMCRSLLDRQKNNPSAGVQLHLMVGRLLSDSCGDIPKILDGLSAIPAENLSDERLRRWVIIHTEALKRINGAANSSPKKTGGLKRKQKSTQSLVEPKEATAPKNDDARLLREKLEGIRSMEKHLDESGSGN